MKRLTVFPSPLQISAATEIVVQTVFEVDGSLDVHVTDGCLFAIGKSADGTREARGWASGNWGSYRVEENPDE